MSRETCDGRGLQVGKISISKAMISHEGTWKTRKIVLELEAPGLNRELPKDDDDLANEADVLHEVD